MKTALLFGTGRIGKAIAYYLDKTGSFDTIYVVDGSNELHAFGDWAYTHLKDNVKEYWKHPVWKRSTQSGEHLADIETLLADVSTDRLGDNEFESLAYSIIDHIEPDCTISALPYHRNFVLAQAHSDLDYGHYLDLGGNNDVVRDQLEIDAGIHSIVPDCGLAPGLANVLAMGLFKRMKIKSDWPIESLEMHVGGLPDKVPDNIFKYARTWSTEGLINEYVEPCEEIVDGIITEVPSLDRRKKLELRHITAPLEFKAQKPHGLISFTTSGGLSTMAHELAGHVKNLSYKTIRFDGSLEPLVFLKDSGFFNESVRENTAIILNDIMPSTTDDIVLVKVEVQTCCEVLAQELAIRPADGFTAMQRATAIPVVMLAVDLCGKGIFYTPQAAPMYKVISDVGAFTEKLEKEYNIKVFEDEGRF